MSLKTIFFPPNADNCRKFIFGLDDIAGAAAVGGLFSAGSGLLGGLFSSGEGRAQRKWATQENALNRQFQHDEAELAYQRNEQTRIAQNQWNSESAQVARMKEAGINPYNAIGGISGSSVSSAGNTASAGNAAGSQMMYQQAKMDWVNNIAQAGLMAAQARKLDAETKNLNAGTQGQELNNEFQQLQNEIFKDYGRIEAYTRLNKLDAERGWTDAQAQLTRIHTKLGEFDLNTMKPQEYNNLVAQEVSTYMKARLDDIMALKTETDRQIALRKLSWELAIMSAQQSYYMEGAFNQRSHGQLAQAGIPVQGALVGMYQQQGGMFEQQGQLSRWNANNSRLGYYNGLQMRNQLGSSFIKAVKSDLERTEAFNNKYGKEFWNQFSYAKDGLFLFWQSDQLKHVGMPSYSINPYQ